MKRWKPPVRNHKKKQALKPTIPYIQKKFEEFNRLCFQGKLPLLPIRLSSSRNALGKICVRKEKNSRGQFIDKDISLFISTRFDLPESEIEDTILHEMIHYYIFHFHLRDSSAHGNLFRSMMNEINRKHHRNITISHHLTLEEKNSDTCKRDHILCVTKWDDGRVCLTSVAKTRLFDMNDFFSSYPGIKELEWYRSTDVYFNQFPNALKPKAYEVRDENILKEHLQDADILEFQGDRIYIRKRKE